MLTSAALKGPSTPAPRRSLAIVIPTLDEELTLRRHLPHVIPLADHVVISDGGSRDRTCEIARELGATVVTGPAGRGRQLNLGARACEDDIVLFLHADTRLPPNTPEVVRTAIEDGNVGGGFYVQFDDQRPLLRLGNRLVAWRTRWFETPLGDQAQYARRDVFEQLGGFRDWPILEDLDFARRLKRLGPVAMLEGPAITAARRFVNQGIVRTVVLNWTIWGLFFLGVSPHRLARLYGKVR
ncbi:MAG: TIGR04283 family arsenosugar biosynthesis glycosyltransferase [Thermoanaerobaculia bacterium]|nr:TIGR04283 family arsenosugar biosynthesis glycosyltransferase [Thermoanaerobaculia bacterium]